MPSSSPTRRRAVIAAAALALLGGCKTDVSVGVDAGPDGGGQVVVTALLDAEAAERLGDPKTQLEVDDLRTAGWEIPEPERTDDGGLEITATHDFDDPSEVEAIVAEVSGETGPLEGFTLIQERSFFRTTTRFAGTVDLAQGIAAFGDPELTEALGGQPLGVPVEELERRLGQAIDRLFGLQIAVRLPGTVEESNAPTQAGNGAVWAPKLGEQVTLTATSKRWNIANIAALVLGGALLLAGAVAGVVAVNRRRGTRTVSVE